MRLPLSFTNFRLPLAATLFCAALLQAVGALRPTSPTDGAAPAAISSTSSSNTGDEITTLAGGGISAGGPATKANLNEPTGVVLDNQGGYFVTVTVGHLLVRIDASGVITTVAGSGYSGFSGDGGPASQASFAFPIAAALDDAGNIYIADNQNDRIRKIDINGVITTFAGGGSCLPSDPRTNFCGDGGSATDARLNRPYAIATDGSGNVYIADSYDNRVRKVNSSGVISTVAGNGTPGFGGDNGPATSAQVADPEGLALDTSGNLFISESTTGRIRKVSEIPKSLGSPYYQNVQFHSLQPQQP